MSESPERWKPNSIESLSTKVGSGSTPRGGSDAYVGKGVPFVRSQNIHFEGFVDEGLVYLNESQAEALKNVSIQADDVLLNITGASIGRVCLAPSRMAGARVNQHVAIIRSIKNSIHPKFLASYLSSPQIQSKIHSEEQGVTRQALTKEWICNLEVPTPPIDEQNTIVAKLDSILPRVKKVRKRLEKIPALLKRFRQSVLTAAVTGKLTERWRGKSAIGMNSRELLERIQSSWSQKDRDRLGIYSPDNYETSLTDLPSSWMPCHIGAIGIVSNGSTPSRNIPEYWGPGYAWVSSGEVKNCQINASTETITQSGFENSSTKLYPAGTVLVAMIGEGRTRGQSAVLNIPACCNQNVAAVVIDHELVVSKFLFYWFLHQYQATREQGVGSGPKALNCQRVRDLPFSLPPLEEQREIVRQVDKLFALADKLEAHYLRAMTRVEKFPQAILAKAFRGELVPQDPNDEPAEKLLERIHRELEQVETAPGSPRRGRGRPKRALEKARS